MPIDPVREYVKALILIMEEVIAESKRHEEAMLAKLAEIKAKINQAAGGNAG